ncbi:MAG: T9SS type A sorting domain-containing protein [Bacteroidetes bacterium]|nr:T9SS type A sorting domain-containing protein [Bacteroidota bacterium]
MKPILLPLTASNVCKWLFLVLTSILGTLPTQAQTITDNAFAGAIREVCPTCIDDANKLLFPATTLTSLDISNKGVSDLTGIGGFTSLKSLNCHSNKLTQLPTLPSTLTTLQCDVNQITSLPTLPAGLTTLSCSYNQLPFLPNLPNTLTALACNNNQLTNLPDLPNTLTSLTCSNNQLVALPNALPAGLKTLFCLSNKLTQLPTLPNSLATLYCQENQISCLPALPSSLSVLYLDTDKISCLPTAIADLKVYNAKGNLVEGMGACVTISNPVLLTAIKSNCSACFDNCNNLTPYAFTLTYLSLDGLPTNSLNGIEHFKSLQNLSCRYAQLESLPDNLPNSLLRLDVQNNKITSLPILPPNLQFLQLAQNKITKIDSLPAALNQLYCNNNLITFLPKLPPTLTVLDCSYNLLRTLPASLSNLNTLIAYNNQLIEIPPLPSRLGTLDVKSNSLTKLPSLPSQLTSLYCDNNSITCLPLLPNSIYSISINNNPISCAPNKIRSTTIYLNGKELPLCGIANINLIAAVQKVCPSCFDECLKIKKEEIEKITNLNLSGQNISSLEGIEMFTSLQSLNISNNPITCLSNIPKNLLNITIDTEKITCIPDSLPELKIYNSLGQLIPTPEKCVKILDNALANTIRGNCYSCINECNILLPPSQSINQISLFQSSAADELVKLKSLTNLICNNCTGEKLPNLPKNLRSLTWINGRLTRIDNLPDSLQEADFNTNNITDLANLPKTLRKITLQNNKLTNFSNLPDFLQRINVSVNQISSIEKLPNTLIELNVQYNKLTSLPDLPSSLEVINCSQNPLITCLPFLPKGLKRLEIYGNAAIKCLPNKVDNLILNTNYTNPLPLCSLGDPNLIMAIREVCSNCFNSCIEINHEEALKITNLDISGKSINSLVGLENFSNIETLNVSKNNIVCIPFLPESLLSLTIDTEKITCLPAHNSNLKVYDKSGQLIDTTVLCPERISDINFVKAIKQQCPTCLDDCNNLLPPAKALENLNIYGNEIKNITGVVGFQSLKTLDCGNNKLTFLPELPSSLTSLSIYNNLIKKLDNLPTNLKYLNCNSNSISEITKLPSSVSEFYCSYNLLTTLPKLPQSLTYLYCNDNYLTNLPELPSEINTIYCNQNPQLECLPFLPSKLRNLSIYNTKITCLPNSVSGIYINANSSLPFCGILDSNLQKAIAENCPTCFDDCMRINSTETQKVKSLNLSGKNIDKIMDLHFFPNLESIDISNNPVSCLSPLPNSVFSIKIDEEKVKCVSSENLNLKVFNSKGEIIPKPSACSIFIPDINFANAIRRSCSNCIDDCNYLLPPAASTTYLSITHNKIADLTGIEGFASLQSLYITGNLLKTLPKLPPTLRTLEVSSNALQSIPSLPNNITELYISNNSLTQLPALPNSLQRLDCVNNKISTIPTLPASLIDLRCSYNQIICLPSLPFSLTYLEFDSHKIGCLKNLKSGISLRTPSSQQLTTYPECSNPIILSDVTANLPNPVTPNTTVSLVVKRNYTGTVAIKWQRKKLNDSDYSDLKIDTISAATNTDFVYTIPNVTVADNGSEYRLVVTSACSGIFTAKAFTLAVKDESLSPPTITASPRDTICLTQTIRLTSNCPSTASTIWSTGENTPFIDIHSSTQTSRTFTAKCSTGAIQSPESPVKTIFWKPFEVILINIGQSKSATKQGQNITLSAWNSQFVTPDNGPSLAFSTQANPSIYYLDNPNKIQPRFWTAYVDICDVSSEGSVSFDMLATPEIGIPVSFNTHENNAPYFMYANRDGFTELYAQNHPNFGFYAENENKQNRYDDGLPAGLYKLSIRYWTQKGMGLTPSLRFPQGTSISYQEHWFRIQSKVGNSSARRSVDSSPDASSFSITPNPAATTAVLSVKQAKHQEIQCEWVDVTGRVHHKSQFVAETDNHTEQLNITSLPTGLYFLRITTPTQQVNLKVTKLD